MKIKLVRFMQFDGAAMQPRVLPGMGRIGSLSPGDVVKDPVDGQAVVHSLEYEPRSGAIIIRKGRHKDNPTDASRSWNRSAGGKDPSADWCAIGIGNAMILGDDDNPPQQQGQQKMK
jgi:hypothetical protein